VQGLTLKAIFGNGAVTKLFWDVRCDRNALLFPWGVDVDGAVDLQLVDLAQQVASGRTPRSVSGLGWVLENTSRAGLSTGAVRNMAVAKRAAKSLFAPEKGGSYSVWRERPLAEVLIEYCTDARTFFALRAFYATYESKYHAALWPAIERRMTASADPAFVARDKGTGRFPDADLVAAVRSASRGNGSSSYGRGYYGSSDGNAYLHLPHNMQMQRTPSNYEEDYAEYLGDTRRQCFVVDLDDEDDDDGRCSHGVPGGVPWRTTIMDLTTGTITCPECYAEENGECMNCGVKTDACGSAVCNCWMD
jgi:hypothetical protein